MDYCLPHRIKDGYGLNISMVEDAVRDGVDTILTCDNGIAAIEQIAFAKPEQSVCVLHLIAQGYCCRKHEHVHYKVQKDCQLRQYLVEGLH